MNALRQATQESTGTSYTPVRAVPNTTDPTISLWRRYRRNRDMVARAQLLEHYLPLVRLLARKLAVRIGSVVEVDDLISAGTLGLVQALESFDLSRANSFATYASRRVHGSMLDELRRRDWVPRSVRSKARKIQHVTNRIESAFGRRAVAEEAAAALEIDMSTYLSWRQAVDGAVQVSIEESPSGESGDAAFLDLIRDPAAEDALLGLGREEQVQTVARALGRLPERERMVLVLYFYEELNLRQIAEVMHLTESRISQIRSAALARLRGALEPELVS